VSWHVAVNSFPPPSPATHPTFLPSSAMLRPQFLAQSSKAVARRLYSSRGPFFLQKLRRNGRFTHYSAPVTPYMHPVCPTCCCSSPSPEETKLFMGYAIASNSRGLKTQGRRQVQTRGYADTAKYTRSKPHMNIGTIGMSIGRSVTGSG